MCYKDNLSSLFYTWNNWLYLFWDTLRNQTFSIEYFSGKTSLCTIQSLPAVHTNTLTLPFQMCVFGSCPGRLSFCGENVPDLTSSTRPRVSSKHLYNTSQTPLYLLFCALSALVLPSSILSHRCLHLPPFCIFDYLLYIASFPVCPSLSLTHSSHAGPISALYSCCFV